MAVNHDSRRVQSVLHHDRKLSISMMVGFVYLVIIFTFSACNWNYLQTIIAGKNSWSDNMNSTAFIRNGRLVFLHVQEGTVRDAASAWTQQSLQRWRRSPASVVRSRPASIQLLMIQPWGSCCMIVTTDNTQYEDRRLGNVSSSRHYPDGDAHCALTCRLRSATGGSAVESKGPAVGILFSAKILWDVQAGWNRKKELRASMATGLVSTQMTALPWVYHSGGVRCRSAKTKNHWPSLQQWQPVALWREKFSIQWQ